MKINTAHCFFEQSGTFKNEFKKLGINAYDYDIQNNFNQTDYVVDLFNEIEMAYNNHPSIFDKIGGDDMIMAFFPCIYFTGFTNPRYFTLENNNYKNFSLEQKLEAIIERATQRQKFYEILIKLVGLCLKRKIRVVIENPFSTEHYLCNNFFKAPDIIDSNRMERGDYFVKPTAYWFFNCEPTYGYSFQNDKEQKTITKAKKGKGGFCSEERSMISPDYARNFICDFLIGKDQAFSQPSLFDDFDKPNNQ